MMKTPFSLPALEMAMKSSTDWGPLHAAMPCQYEEEREEKKARNLLVYTVPSSMNNDL